MNIKKRLEEITVSWDDILEERLARNPEEALGYLNASLEEEPEVFLIMLRHVLNAHQLRMQGVAKASGIHRVSLHKVLSAKGNPTLATLTRVLKAMNLRLRVEALPAKKRGRKSA